MATTPRHRRPRAYRRLGRVVNGTLQWELGYEGTLQPSVMKTGASYKYFVYALGGNAPDVILEGSTRYRVVKDHLGSVRLVLRIPDAANGTPAVVLPITLADGLASGLDDGHRGAERRKPGQRWPSRGWGLAAGLMMGCGVLASSGQKSSSESAAGPSV